MNEIVQLYCENPEFKKQPITKYRSLFWKVFLRGRVIIQLVLGILPLSPESWTVLLQKERSQYEELKGKLMFDPSKLDGNLEINNPLSLDEN
ncbi:hypothetical protein HDU91_000848, partial [Kappamyces sp. JEL0680]